LQEQKGYLHAYIINQIVIRRVQKSLIFQTFARNTELNYAENFSIEAYEAQDDELMRILAKLNSYSC